MLTFLCQLIEASAEPLAVTSRAMIFEALRALEPGIDTLAVLAVLDSLLEHGRDISYLEFHIGPFLVDLFPHCASGNLFLRITDLVANVFRYNFTAMDRVSANEVIQLVCLAATRISDIDNIRACLAVLRVLVIDNHVPVECLSVMLRTLCHLHCNVQVQDTCTHLVEDILRTPVIIAAVGAMCAFLQDQQYDLASQLRCGAVHMLTSAAWGHIELPALRPEHILSALLVAAQQHQAEVNLAILRSLQVLLSRHGASLSEVAGDVVIEVTQVVCYLHARPVHQSLSFAARF